MNTNPKEKRLALLGALLGTITEYYDYSLYGFSSLYLAHVFFSYTKDSISALVLALGVFAIGYLSKPFGSLLFGHIGDKYGRKVSLQITVLGIGIPTLVIGLMPGYDSIGMFAPLTVIVCRFLQGIFAGGQYDGAALFVLEHYGEHRRGFSSAISRMSAVIGMLLAALLTGLCSELTENSWRWPFLFSLPLTLLTLYCRKFFVETPEFVQAQIDNKDKNRSDFSFRTILSREQIGKLLIVMMICGTFSGTCQLIIVFLKSFLATLYPAYKTQHNLINILGLVLFGISMFCTAILSSRISRTKIVYCALNGSLFFSLVLFYGLWQKHLPIISFCQLILPIFLAPPTALLHSFIYTLFPVQERYRSIAIGHALGSMALSGTAPVIAMTLYSYVKEPQIPILYLIALLLVGMFFFTKANQLTSKENLAGCYPARP